MVHGGGGLASHFDSFSGHQSTDSDVSGQEGIREVALRKPVRFSMVQFTELQLVT